MSEHDIVAEWIQIAYDDYDSALHLFETKHPKPLEIICYHCQQSIEKSLKAFLCAKQIEIPKTHNTGILCKLCAESDIRFENFQETCYEMVVYATNTRYPIRIEIEEQDAERALRQASEIFDFVSTALRIEIVTDAEPNEA
jgi:HEPN domain-containing protein